MSVQNPNRVVTKQDLADFYGEILPYLGGMPEMLANKFSKGDLYSTDEKMIGQWIDGKPLYQKVLTKTISATSKIGTYTSGNDGYLYQGHISISSDIPNIDTGMVDVGHSFYISSSATRGFMGAWYEKDTGDIWFSTLYDRSDVSATFVVNYTKTTDSAISIGSDTDYSTTEKIVGTWIDGKPIYQKTVDLGSQQTLTSQTWFETNIDCSNISTLVNVLCLDSPYNVKAFNASIQNGTLKLMAFRSSEDYVRVVTIQYTKTS
jgi:hypothetical protein